MALIGTISGSNGTSTTAISGSLVIADRPSSTFPTLSPGVKLFVSGTRVIAGPDSPTAIFGGDTFVSGILGADSFLQLKPVGNVSLPTNTTASYIYTSGSTNDLYFSQFQPSTGLGNTVRLRWLEGIMTTGLLHGGVLSTANGTNTFSITSGSGLIVDFNASLTSEPYPTVKYISWPAYVSSSLPSIASTQITYIAIDNTGALVKQSVPYTDGDFENKIVIGRVLHQAGSVTNGTITAPSVAYGQSQHRTDFIRAFGPLKLNGHAFYALGASPTMQIGKDAGDSYVLGRNYTSNPSSPDYVKSTTDTAVTTSKIYREYVNGSGTPILDTNGNLGYTDIDPTQYNNGGSLSTTPAGQYTIQRVFWFPNSSGRAFVVYYGSTLYNSIASAEGSLSRDSFTEGANTSDSTIFLGYLILKGNATDLTNAGQAKFIMAGTFREIGASGGGGSIAEPAGSDTFVQFNDAAVFGGTNDLRFTKSDGTLRVKFLYCSIWII